MGVEAELHDARSVAGRAAMLRCRELMNMHAQRANGRSIGQASWAGMSPLMRRMLLTLATARNERDIDGAVSAPWAAFTDDERATMGAVARQWRRELERAGWLR